MACSTCIGRCKDYTVSRKGYPNTTAFYSIAKRCPSCAVFIGIEHERCPCCNTNRFRTKPRKAESKRRILARRMELKDLNKQFRLHELNAAFSMKENASKKIQAAPTRL